MGGKTTAKGCCEEVIIATGFAGGVGPRVGAESGSQRNIGTLPNLAASQISRGEGERMRRGSTKRFMI